MNLTTIFAIIILAYTLDFLTKKYVKSSMVVGTIIMLGIMLLADIWLFNVMFFSKISARIPIMAKIMVSIILILPIWLIKGEIAHTIRILDFCINKNKLLERGYIEKGVIQEIKSYGLRRRSKEGQYLIVDVNGEKIKSLPFRYHRTGVRVKTTYKSVYNDGKFSKEKIEEVLGERAQDYNVGDEIDVIVYNNKKYVKLNED